MRQARDDNAFVGFHAIPDPERKAPNRRAAMLARAADDLILERVLTDADQGVADLCLRDVGLGERCDADGAAQGAG